MSVTPKIPDKEAGETHQFSGEGLPEWMKVRLAFDTPGKNQRKETRRLVEDSRVATVCEEASCPNLGHCWQQGTATFMIMGEICTRRCGFCDVATGRPAPLDPQEPERLARTIQELQLRHTVITSVDRDELKDCGSEHFARVILRVKELSPATRVEVLIPDFKARKENLERIWAAKPDIINHNVETVPRLFKTIAPQCNYQNTLQVLKDSSEAGFLTKSGIILGMGETVEEVKEVLRDLRAQGVDMLTIGQYLQPTPQHTPLKEYVKPNVFKELGLYARELKFSHIESGPLVRSSYHAGDSVDKLLENLKNEKAKRDFA